MLNIKIKTLEDGKVSVKVEAFGSEGVLINEFTAMLDAIESKPQAAALFMVALANHIEDIKDD